MMWWMIEDETPTKTFEELRNENPNIYDGCLGYVWSDASNGWTAQALDESTKELIEEWFDERVVGDTDAKFVKFFRRKLNSCALRYAQQYRIDLSAFDPLVADYIERQIEGENSIVKNSNKNILGVSNNVRNDSSGSTVTETTTPSIEERKIGVRNPNLTESTSGTKSPNLTTTENGTRTPNLVETGIDTRTPDLSERTSGTSSENRQTNTTGSSQAHDESNGESIAKKGHKVAPQSIEYASGSGGSGAGGYSRLPGYDWRYLTGQEQADAATTNETDGRNSSTGSENGTTSGSNSSTTTRSGRETTQKNLTKKGSETNNVTKKETGNETTASTTNTTGTESTNETLTRSGNEKRVTLDTSGLTSQVDNTTSNNETANGTESGTDTKREIATGRSGLTPQEAFAKAKQYLRGSTAWEWLYKELNECFLGVYVI